MASFHSDNGHTITTYALPFSCGASQPRNERRGKAHFAAFYSERKCEAFPTDIDGALTDYYLKAVCNGATTSYLALNRDASQFGVRRIDASASTA